MQAPPLPRVRLCHPTAASRCERGAPAMLQGIARHVSIHAGPRDHGRPAAQRGPLAARLAPAPKPALGSALAALPALAQACVECRQRVMDSVFDGEFLGTLAVLLVPVVLTIAVALYVGTRR